MCFKSLLFSCSKIWMIKEWELVQRHLLHWDHWFWSLEERCTECQNKTKRCQTQLCSLTQARTAAGHCAHTALHNEPGVQVGVWRVQLTVWDKFLRETVFSVLKNSINTTMELTNVFFLLSELFKPLINLQSVSSALYDVLPGVFQI